LITVEDKGQILKVVDIDIIDGYVAGVLEDHSFCIWKIDQDQDANTMEVELLVRATDTSTIGQVQRLRWHYRGSLQTPNPLDRVSLLVMCETNVFAMDPAALVSSRGSLLEDVFLAKVESTEEVSLRLTFGGLRSR
jgi:hypothetical protein